VPFEVLISCKGVVLFNLFIALREMGVRVPGGALVAALLLSSMPVTGLWFSLSESICQSCVWLGNLGSFKFGRGCWFVWGYLGPHA
jgi:hypothetical protein